MFRKSKNKRNIRQKDDSGDGDEEEVNIQLSDLVTSRRPVSSFQNITKNEDDTEQVSEKLRKTVVTYSDNEDDECDEFKIKKKNPKKRYQKFKESLNNLNCRQNEKIENISTDISSYKSKNDDVIVINNSADSDIIFLGETLDVNEGDDIVNKEEILKLKKLREKKRKDLGNGYIPLEEGEIITINSDDSDVEKEDTEQENDQDEECRESSSDSSIDFEAEQMSKVIKKKQIVQAKFEEKRNKIVMGGKFDSDEMFDAQDPDDDDYENRTYIDINFELDNEPQRSIKTIIESLISEKKVLQIKYNELIGASEHIQRDKENCQERIDYLEANKEFNISKCVKYKELKKYIESLLEVINTKINVIEDLEKKFIEIVKEKNTKVISLRNDIIKAEVNYCLAEMGNIPPYQIDPSTWSLFNTLGGTTDIQVMQFECNTLDNDTKSILKNETLLGNEKLDKIFEGTEPIYSDVNKIIIKIFEWLEIDEKGFNQCNIYQHVWKFISPFIKKEMITWNPLFNELTLKINKFSWYEKLLRIGVDETLIIDKNHEYIVNLIPLIIENVVIPKLTKIVKEIWDPYSNGQCEKLSSLLFNILDETPTLNSSTETLNTLFEAIVNKFEKSINESLIDVKYTGINFFTPNNCPRLLNRNYNIAINFVKNILHFKLILSSHVINILIDEKIAKKYCIPSLENYLL